MASSQVSHVLFETWWVDQRFFFFFTSNPVVICAVFPGINGDPPVGGRGGCLSYGQLF